MINTLLAKVFGTQNERELKRLRPLVGAINELEAGDPRRCPTSELRGKTAEFRERVAQRRDARRPAARGLRGRPRGRPPRAEHAALRRPAHRRHGAAQRQDRRDEDRRRQDARRDAAAYLNALDGKGVHVVTVNDYLARRDSEWMGRIYRFLGHVGRRHPARPERRRSARSPTAATSPTAPTTSSASTTCATT